MKYLDEHKRTTTQEQAKYILIEEGVVLKQKHNNAIQLPIFNLIWEFGKKVAIITNKDSVLNKLKKNIKNQWWGLIGWSVDNSSMINIWEHKNTIYEVEEKNIEVKISDISVLSKALSLLSQDLQLSDNLLHLKDLVNNVLKPSDVVGELYPLEYEKQEILFSDELGIILDLRQSKWNVSGNVFDSLYRCFGQNISKLNAFLEKMWIDWVEEPDIYYIYNINENQKIEFRKDWIYHIKTSWDAEVETCLIETWLKLVKWYKSNYNVLAGLSTSSTEKYYVFENWVTFPYFSNSEKFNRWLGPQWLRMLTSWKAFQQIYSWLDKWIEDNNIPEVDVIEYNGIDLDKKVFVHWWKLIYNEAWKEYLVYAPKYAVVDNNEQITLEEAKELIRDYNKYNYQYIILLWMIGALLKKNFTDVWIYTPLLQVIGFTESWKTELIQLILQLFDYSIKPIKEWNETLEPRMSTLEWTTKFAIQRMLGDYSPLFFDEFTGKVDKSIEELFRWVFNEKKSEKWNADQTVNIYRLLSPLIIGWERSPEYNSVLNRSIYLQIDANMKTTPKRFNEIKKSVRWKSVIADVWNKVKDVDLSKYVSWFDKVNWRVEANYTFLEIVNDIVWLFDKEELHNIIEPAYKLQQSILNWKDELRVFFNNLLVLWKKEQNIWVFSNKNDDIILEIFVPEDLSTKNHAILWIKWLVWDELNDLTNITINISKLLREKAKWTEWIIQSLFRHLRNYKNRVWQEFLFDYVE